VETLLDQKKRPTARKKKKTTIMRQTLMAHEMSLQSNS
jgi:hypothetical protein